MFKLTLFFLSSVLIAQDDGLKAYQSGDYEKARKYYESILEEKVENATAQFGLGTTAFQQQDLQVAIDAFHKALETDSKELQSKAYYNMANVLASQKMNEEALAFYRKALELDPSDKDAKHNYEMIRYQQQQQEQEQQDKSTLRQNPVMDQPSQNRFPDLDDLKNHRAEWVEPVSVPFRGYRL